MSIEKDAVTVLNAHNCGSLVSMVVLASGGGVSTENGSLLVSDGGVVLLTVASSMPSPVVQFVENQYTAQGRKAEPTASSRTANDASARKLQKFVNPLGCLYWFRRVFVDDDKRWW
jgi:hypothetical protein